MRSIIDVLQEVVVCLAVTILFLATALVFLLSATVNARSAARDAVPAVLRGQGVTARMLRRIAALELAAAIGLVAGLFLRPLGIAAAAGLVLLMLGAIGYHLRAGDRRGVLLGPAGPLLLSAAALVVGLASL